MNSSVFWKFITIEKEKERIESKEDLPEPINLEEEAEQESEIQSDRKSKSTIMEVKRKMINIKKKELKNIQILAYYFSASWCRHCKEFTPLLVDFYNEVNKESKKLEIIHLSYD